MVELHALPAVRGNKLHDFVKSAPHMAHYVFSISGHRREAVAAWLWGTGVQTGHLPTCMLVSASAAEWTRSIDIIRRQGGTELAAEVADSLACMG